MPRRLVHARSAAVATLVAVMGALLITIPAQAAVTGASSTTTTTVTGGTTTTLTGMSVTALASDSVSVSVSTTIGTLTVDPGASGITLAYGYAATGSVIAFTGTGSQVNAALGSIQLTVPGSAKDSSATIAIVAQEVGTSTVVYSADTGHYYQYVASSGISWSDARAAALLKTFGGQSGYLATVPSAAVNSLITSKIPGALNVWLGGRAVAGFGGYALSWQWMNGPLAGTEFTRCSDASASVACNFVDSAGFYRNWSPNEPNNYNGIEQSMVTNWTTANGLWNDLADSTSAASGYVVEYGDLFPGSTGFTDTFSDDSLVAIVGVPDPPTGVSATSGLGQATVSFTAPVNNGGAAIGTYLITASSGGATFSCAASPCTVSGLTGGDAYTFDVKARNIKGDSTAASSSAITIGLAPGAPTGMTTTAVVGHAYSDSVSAAGYPAPTYLVTGGAALPGGLSLDGTSGAITGTPTTAGAWSVTITATNTYGSAAATFTGTTGQAPIINTTTLGTLTWGTPVDFYLDVDAIPAAVLSIDSGTLPLGLTLDANGRLHGIPSAMGVYTLSIDASNTHGTDTQAYNGTVVMGVPSAPAIDSITAGDGTLSVAFTAPSSTGGGAIITYRYSLDGGGTWLPRATGTDESPLVITGLSNGVTYSVMVLGVNAAGPGVASAALTGRAGVTLAASGFGPAPIRWAISFLLVGTFMLAARSRLRLSPNGAS